MLTNLRSYSSGQDACGQPLENELIMKIVEECNLYIPTYQL